MSIKVWTPEQLVEELVTRWQKDTEGGGETSQGWYDSIKDLAKRAHARGDGVAIYVNNDLGHPDLGQWQVVSYGGGEAQLESRGVAPSLPIGRKRFLHGDDMLPTTLPDIGGRINWRYTLEAVVPAPRVKDGRLSDALDRAIASENKNPQGLDEDGIAALQRPFNDPTVDCCGRDAADCDCESDVRVVTVRVRVTSLSDDKATEEEANALVLAALQNGIDIWHDTGGQAGFSEQDDTGIDTYDRGIRLTAVEEA